jgi:hypothetical protein
MKTLLLTILMSVFVSSTPFAFSSIHAPASEGETVTNTVQKKKKISSFKKFRIETEKKLGRKLGLFERMGLWYYSKLTGDPEADAKKANNHALTGFILGVCGLALMPLLSIPGFFFSKSALTKEKLEPGTLSSSNKGLAKAGLILSIIGFVYLLLIVVYVVLILAAYGFGY